MLEAVQLQRGSVSLVPFREPSSWLACNSDSIIPPSRNWRFGSQPGRLQSRCQYLIDWVGGQMDRGLSRTARRSQHIPFKLMTSLIAAMGLQVMMMNVDRDIEDCPSSWWCRVGGEVAGVSSDCLWGCCWERSASLWVELKAVKSRLPPCARTTNTQL